MSEHQTKPNWGTFYSITSLFQKYESQKTKTKAKITKEMIRNCSKLRGNKNILQLNAMCDPWLDHGFGKKISKKYYWDYLNMSCWLDNSISSIPIFLILIFLSINLFISSPYLKLSLGFIGG